MDARYFESHVTISPVFDTRLEEFTSLAQRFGFRVADLFMVKKADDPGQPSRKDSFCTGRGRTFCEMKKRMDSLVCELRAHNFKVWRAKIEAVLHDERFPKC